MRIKGKYSRFIPSIYKEARKDASFMERYFRTFEDVLDGIDVDRIDKDDFLTWFAGWMGLTLKEDWDIQKRRDILAKIIPLYRIRGTKRGLEEYLKLCTGYGVEIIEKIESFQVGITSHVGIDTILGGLPPHHFIVRLIVPGKDDLIKSKRKMVEELINMEKPAHTTYKLRINYE